MTHRPPHFEPTRAAAQHALAAVRPEAYSGSRNHLNGAVTQLSPYFTHGLLSQREAFDFLHHRAPLHPQHKLVYEFGWRAYFRHVWSHLGEGILSSLHPGPLPDLAYHPEVPGDVRQARSGVPVFVAYYRRALPRFAQVKQLLDNGAIGTPRSVRATSRHCE